MTIKFSFASSNDAFFYVFFKGATFEELSASFERLRGEIISRER